MLALVFWHRKSGIPLHRTVIAHTADGRSFVGILVGVYDDSYVLRHARTIPEDAAMVGDVILPRETNPWFQADVPDRLLKLNEAS